MCKMLQVSASGYYNRFKNPVGLREQKEQELVEQIKQVHEQRKCRYGSPRIAVELQQQGTRTSRPLVARLMQKYCIKSIVRKKYQVQTTDSNHAYTVAENYLSRDFKAARPAEKWVPDLTYIRTGEGLLYLTVVLDLADWKVWAGH